jgi:hypothetical protein
VVAIQLVRTVASVPLLVDSVHVNRMSLVGSATAALRDRLDSVLPVVQVSEWDGWMKLSSAAVCLVLCIFPLEAHFFSTTVFRQ